jgi:hypothetical protein
MRLSKLRVYFETSPALRLLRSPNAPFIIDWLDQQFKQAGRIAIPHSDLLAALAEYQEELRETDPDQLIAKPETYLADWSGPEKLWLRRFLEAGRDEPFISSLRQQKTSSCFSIAFSNRTPASSARSRD